ARAVYHDAVSAAAKEIAASLALEAVPIAREIVAALLKNGSQHPYVEESVLEAVRPVARDGALAAIRRWSEEAALPKAEAAARKVLEEQMQNGPGKALESTVLAGVRVIIENKLAGNSELSAAEREKVLDDYLNDEAKRSASEALAKHLSPELRRNVQAAAEQAIAEVASTATEDVARDEALNAARLVASDTAKTEISRLILAEAQRRAAKMTRERLQEESSKVPEEARAEYCQEEAKKIAEQAIQSVADEIADLSSADLDLARARELALSAATAVAREFSGAYQIHDQENNQISKKTIAFLVAQIIFGCAIIWFFLLGGYESCEPTLRKVLPERVYRSLYYRPAIRPAGDDTDASNADIEDLLEESRQEQSGELNKAKPDNSEVIKHDAAETGSAKTEAASQAVKDEAVNPAPEKGDVPAVKPH
ncbi:MAG: hypothetical protein K2X27_08295, partial [Candidatus Obscuribacterales bacterium]|nr:hypothetical protein [Candidatus Obscuribacterales bacterium]